MMSAEGQEDHFATSGTFPAATEALESESVRAYTDPFFGDSKIGDVIATSVEQFPSFVNGPDTGVIGAALAMPMQAKPPVAAPAAMAAEAFSKSRRTNVPKLSMRMTLRLAVRCRGHGRARRPTTIGGRCGFAYWRTS